MKHTIFLISIFCLLQSCSSKIDCSNLKDGIFELETEDGTTIIERNGNSQIETLDGINYYSEVEWVDECKYLLKNHKNHNKELIQEELNDVYTVEIIKIFNDSIYVRSTANYTKHFVDHTLKIVKLK